MSYILKTDGDSLISFSNILCYALRAKGVMIHQDAMKLMVIQFLDGLNQVGIARRGTIEGTLVLKSDMGSLNQMCESMCTLIKARGVGVNKVQVTAAFLGCMPELQGKGVVRKVEGKAGGRVQAKQYVHKQVYRNSSFLKP